MPSPPPLHYRNIHCVPVFHNRLQFALEVRKRFTASPPAIVAVELPDIYLSDVWRGIDRLPRLSLLCLQETDANTLRYIPVFPNDAVIEGLRLARENRLPVASIDLAVKDYQVFPAEFAVPDDSTIPQIGLDAFYQAVLPHLPAATLLDQRREQHMAIHLRQMSQRFESILLICGMAHWAGIVAHLEHGTEKVHAHTLETTAPPFLAKLGPKARYTLLEEIPYLVLHYELARRFAFTYDRFRLFRRLLAEARRAPLLAEEHFSLRDIQTVLQYAHKLAHTEHYLSPDLFNLLLAAKQTLGDDYALEVMELALAYPYEDDAAIPEIEFDPNELFFALGGRKITLQRRLPIPNHALKPERQWQKLALKRRKKDDLPDHYISRWLLFGFFSHIPEDLQMEGFVDRLAIKMASELNDTEEKIEEFQGSLMDGIAMRETIRQSHQGKLFVKEIRRKMQPIGAWVIMFDEALREADYPWGMSLSAEHHNESDIAFYAANPYLHPVSQEIVRSHYGALLALKPPLPAAEKILWDDLDVDEDCRKEQILRVAIAKSPRPGILYLAKEPPDAYYFRMATQYHKTLYFLPMSRVSLRHLKRIQRFHLLREKGTRDIAEDYI